MVEHGPMMDAAELAVTVQPFVDARRGGSALRQTFDRLHAMGFRWVQLSATQPGLRPRELDASARRDLLATLRRRELAVSGIDAWIPSSHFADEQHVDRAASALLEAVELAGDLGRAAVSVVFPRHGAEGVIDAAAAAAERSGVVMADHIAPVVERSHEHVIGIGVDPAAWLSAGENPADIINQYSTQLTSARVCDLLTTGLRGPIGTGDGYLDVLAYKVALSVADYQRPVILDARQWTDPWSGIEQARRAW